MKRKVINFFLIFSIAILGVISTGSIGINEACCSDGTKNIVLKVEGMTCTSCNVAVNIALKKLSGVVEAIANYKLGRADVEYMPDEVTPKQMIEAINKIGKYKASIYNSGKG